MIAIPAWLASKAVTYGAAALAGIALGSFVTHKLDGIPLANARAETAAVQSRYDGYKAGAAIRANEATIKALDEKRALEQKVADIQAKFEAQRKLTNAKNAELNKILSGAKPGDEKPIGTVASSYYERLRVGP